MRIKKITALLLGVAMTMGLTACGGGNGSGQDGAVSSGETEQNEAASSGEAGENGTESSGDGVSINFYAWSDEEGIFNKLADAYMAQHENVSINLQFVPPDDYNMKMLTVLGGSGDVDCFAIGSPGDMAQYQSKGSIIALDDRIQAANTDTSGYGEMLSSIKIDGQIYGLPYKTSSWVVYYNKDIFDAAGVAYPTDSWTWDEYYEIAGQLTSGEGSEKIYGSLNFQPTSPWWGVPAHGMGAVDPLDDEHLHEWMRAAEFCKSMSDAGYQPLYEDMASEAGVDYTGNFLQGKYGMYYTGDWGIEMLNTAIANGDGDVNYDIAPLPHWEGENPMTVGAPATLMIASNAKNPDAAFDFISFCTGAEGAEILLDNEYFPAWQSEETIAAYTEGKEVPEHIEFIVNQTITSQVPCNENYNTASNVVTEEVSLYLLGEQDIETTETNIKNRLQDEGLSSD